ncbi:MAG: hypothetical protein J6D08_00010 [Lachnospiraceae bacterium]|nr:hypothetical protein [Lachnospiraceae bacterium]
MKRKKSKMWALLMALVVTVSVESPHAYAKEAVNETDCTTGDLEISPLPGEYAIPEKGLTAEQFVVEADGSETELFAADEISTASAEEPQAEQTSVTSYGSVSGYLSQTGNYALYTADLTAGTYLQARLTPPANTSIDYDLVLYDSALSVIKVSNYFTYINGTAALEESIGYLAAADERVYIGVFSSAGGSETEAYTLDFSITTNFTGSGEPNENAQEAAAMNIGTSNISVTGDLCSAIDNDWYTFTVPDNAENSKIRLDITNASRCRFEIYTNLVTNYYVMYRIVSGTNGEITLPAGTYFLRVISAETVNQFIAGGTAAYKLTEGPVSEVNRIEITKYSGYEAAANVNYNNGPHYRISQHATNPDFVTITGWTFLKDSIGNNYAAQNVGVTVSVTNDLWIEAGHPEYATTYGTAVSGSNGFFTATVYLYPAVGGLTYESTRTTHYYDLMSVKAQVTSDEEIETEDTFYFLKECISY